MERGFKSWAEKESIAIRKALGIAAHGRLPARSLLKHLGAVVTTPARIPGMTAADVRQLSHVDPSAWSAVTASCNGTTVVIVNDAHSDARRESNMHHEAAHLVRGHEPCELVAIGTLTFRVYDDTAEEEASWLAGCLHLPRRALLSALGAGSTEETIAAAYVASPEMVRFRRSVTAVDRQLHPRTGRRREP